MSAAGFEPTTSASGGQRSIQLSYAPDGSIYADTHGPVNSWSCQQLDSTCRCVTIVDRMKLTVKTLPVLGRLSVLSMLVGTLAWELVERVLALAGISLSLGVGPIGFDIRVVAVTLIANPGTIAGLVPAILLFRKL